jgi:hypothetical protein
MLTMPAPVLAAAPDAALAAVAAVMDAAAEIARPHGDRTSEMAALAVLLEWLCDAASPADLTARHLAVTAVTRRARIARAPLDPRQFTADAEMLRATFMTAASRLAGGTPEGA